MDAGWMMWRRWPETFRIVMESSQSGLSLPHIVATSRVDVQRGVAHAAMWRKTRHPCTMRGYDYCGLQAARPIGKPLGFLIVVPAFRHLWRNNVRYRVQFPRHVTQ